MTTKRNIRIGDVLTEGMSLSREHLLGRVSIEKRVTVARTTRVDSAISRVLVQDARGHLGMINVQGWQLDETTCEHEWQEQPGEPPIDVCSRCGAVQR
jgi:hypothetical protein